MILLLYHTSMLTTLMTLALPLVVPPLSNPKSLTTMVKLAYLQSLVPLTIFIETGLNHTTTNFTWISTEHNLQASIRLDLYTTLFLPTALFITWAILEFTNWYMATDPALPRFSKYLLLFLIAMLTLTTANNLLQLFIGWEGVGIMSFLLIGWWFSRTNATTSALQAILYNRTGDIGLILALVWLAMNYNTLDLQLILSHQNTPILPLLGLILAAMGKSAQFGLHPWLPAAMEGPTPVSALLHSSTMVVAGIFLLIRTHPMLTTNPTASAICLCLGALTSLFAALCALTQNDIKKIVAFSTSSQLGLMMLTLGLNQPLLAFLHIITHAFFKALLFLCSGSIIHSLSNEQDIRKMGATQKSMPITSACLTLASLALMGTPFLAGFYTKDPIIESLTTSPLNAWALTTTLVATSLTAAYSTRLILHTHLDAPRYSLSRQDESSKHQTRPLIRLAAGSVMTGLIITHAVLPAMPQTMTMGLATKTLALTVAILGLTWALDLASHTLHLSPQHTPTTNTKAALTQLLFFSPLTHRYMPKKSMMTAHTQALQLNDLLWLEALAPTLAAVTSKAAAKKLSKLHTGLIKTHLMPFTFLAISTLLYARALALA